MPRNLSLRAAMVALVALIIASPPVAAGQVSAGEAADTLHGRVVSDPFRWLEDFESERAQAWIEAQQEVTNVTLRQVAYRDSIRARLSVLFDIPHIGGLYFRGGMLFFVRREGDQEQSVLYVQPDLEGEPVELIDPDSLSDGDPVTLDWWYPSVDGSLLAYGLSTGGSEMSTLHVMDVASRHVLADTIPRTRLVSLAWRPDGAGFYYTRFPAAGEVPEGEEFFHRKVYYHELGAHYIDDPLVFGEGFDMRVWTGVSVSTCGRFLIGYAFRGSSKSDLYVRDLQRDEGWVPIVEGVDAISTGVAIGDVFYMLTRKDSPNGRIVRVDLLNPREDAWVEIVPEAANSIESYMYAGGRLLVDYLDNAHERAVVFDVDGERIADIPLPDMVSISDWSGDWRRSDVFLNLNSYLLPPTVLRYDLESREATTYMAVYAPVDVDRYVTEQVWYPSHDGTVVSMFIVRRRDLALDGDNPTILTGYGGFNMSETPGFARNRYAWLEQGGVYAAPNLRGGGEYGENWHRSGMLGEKQNTFDDFIAAAEWLVANGYTRPSRLAVWGGSNGGLLVTAFLTQRPDLAAAAIADVPLTDMIRFHLLYGGSIWTPEYGSPEDPEAFEWLYDYSPYHSVVDGTEYPAVLLTTGETDTRVHPSHALKMAARLQEASSSLRPVLLRYERSAGHAMGARMTTLLDEYVDYYAFLFRELGVEYRGRASLSEDDR
jgi:prolyl oligopeptidase